MHATPCPICHSPREADWNERDERVVASPHSRGLAEEAIAWLRRVDIGYGDDRPMLGEGVLETVLAGEDAIRVRQAFILLVDEAGRCLAAVPETCPECGAPSQEVFTRDGRPAGRLWSMPADDRFRDALDAVRRLQVSAPAGTFNSDNPYYDRGDEQAPFLSEAFLYTLLGKDPARSILAATGRLVQAMGERLR